MYRINNTITGYNYVIDTICKSTQQNAQIYGNL